MGGKFWINTHESHRQDYRRKTICPEEENLFVSVGIKHEAVCIVPKLSSMSSLGSYYTDDQVHSGHCFTRICPGHFVSKSLINRNEYIPNSI